MWPSQLTRLGREVTPDNPAMVGSPSSAPEGALAGAETPIDDGPGSPGDDMVKSLGEKLRSLKTGGSPEEIAVSETAASSSWQQPHTKHAQAAQIAQVPSQVSIGTVGHPVSCGQACRYVKRKGGCRDGAQCRNCHLCFWVRNQEEQPARPWQANRKPMISSMGTVGHPLTCGEPCFAAWTEGGCPDSNCSKCHRCTPGTQDQQVEPGAQSRRSFCGAFSGAYFGRGEVAAPQAPASPEFSVGSFGHPLTCAVACKYARKPKGCKDGRYCTRCHLCHWHRHPPPTQLPSTRWEGVIHETL